MMYRESDWLVIWGGDSLIKLELGTVLETHLRRVCKYPGPCQRLGSDWLSSFRRFLQRSMFNGLFPPDSGKKVEFRVR